MNAIGDQSPEGRDPQGLDAKHASGGPEGICPTPGAVVAQPTAEQVREAAAIPDALWPFVQHHKDCVLRGHWMEAADNDCDCGLAKALAALPKAEDKTTLPDDGLRSGDIWSFDDQHIGRAKAGNQFLETRNIQRPPGLLNHHWYEFAVKVCAALSSDTALHEGGLREPTKAMLNAARDWSYGKYGKPIGNDAATGCWQAMLDAALSGKGVGQ
jgi:hypothetical protein